MSVYERAMNAAKRAGYEVEEMPLGVFRMKGVGNVCCLESKNSVLIAYDGDRGNDEFTLNEFILWVDM